MTPLSQHFTLEELTFSSIALRHDIDNTPNAVQVANLTRLALTLLEPARAIIGAPMTIDSGFRVPALNLLVGSTSKHSEHLDGLAADCIFPPSFDLRNIFDALRTNLTGYDQIIIECGAWIHIAAPEANTQPRGDQLIATGRPGAWSYQLA